jgi:preprotein translocase subunit SecE
MGAIKRFREFIEEVRRELHRTSWPSKKEVKGTTLVVVVMVLIMSVYLGGVDWLFSHMAEWLLANAA